MNQEPQPGGTPTVTAVIRLLKAAGFQHARYTEAASSPLGSGARVRKGHLPGTVTVAWQEGDQDSLRRMAREGVTSAADLPPAPLATELVAEYAEALRPRYHVEVGEDGRHLTLTARAAFPSRPPGLPSAPAVRAALAFAGAAPTGSDVNSVRVVSQPDHTRVAVLDDRYLEGVTSTLEEEGWLFTQTEGHQHYALLITGVDADRRAAAKARRRAAARPPAADPAPAPSDPLPTPQPAPAPAAPPTADRTPAEPQEPAKEVVDWDRGHRYSKGMRVTHAGGGMWTHGEVTDVDPATRAVHVLFTSYQVPPPPRGGGRPGPVRELENPKVSTVYPDKWLTPRRP